MRINVNGGNISQEEINAYVKHIENEFPDKTIDTLDINVDGEFVDLNYTFEAYPFERIRRITGYLVGTVDRFNNAKQAEVKDRVKHMSFTSV